MKFTSILIPRWRLGFLKGTLMALMFSAICSAGHALEETILIIHIIQSPERGTHQPTTHHIVHNL